MSFIFAPNKIKKVRAVHDEHLFLALIDTTNPFSCSMAKQKTPLKSHQLKNNQKAVKIFAKYLLMHHKHSYGAKTGFNWRTLSKQKRTNSKHLWTFDHFRRSKKVLA